MERRGSKKAGAEKVQTASAEVKKLAKDLKTLTWDSEDSISQIKLQASTGCTQLDLSLSGGPPYKRVINIIGDSSTGKSLLTTSIMAFEQQINNSIIIVDDPEGTNEKVNAEGQGVNVHDVIYQDPPSETVEIFFERLLELVKKDFDRPLVYILDSLDSLTSSSEVESKVEDAGFAKKLGKANIMSQGFRRICRAIANKNIMLIIVSQTRDKIGAMFGEKWTVAGGRALEFYCTQRILLAKLKKIIDKEKKVYGQRIKFKVIKNKIGKPFKEGEFDILFDYGIDDVGSMADYLKKLYFDKSYEINDKKFKSREEFVNYIEDNDLEAEIINLVKQVYEEQNKPLVKRKRKFIKV